MRAFAPLLSLLALPLAALGGDHSAPNTPHGHRRNVRHYLASDELASGNNTHLARRVTGVPFTYYDAGMGACGQPNTASDFVRLVRFFCLRIC